MSSVQQIPIAPDLFTWPSDDPRLIGSECASTCFARRARVAPRPWCAAAISRRASPMHMAETGLCAHGEQEKMIRDGETEIGGRLPVNTDGGLLANGEPVGASGLRQVHEVCRQLRGEPGDRQSPRQPKVGMCQVYGAPGLSAVVVLAR